MLVDGRRAWWSKRGMTKGIAKRLRTGAFILVFFAVLCDEFGSSEGSSLSDHEPRMEAEGLPDAVGVISRFVSPLPEASRDIINASHVAPSHHSFGILPCGVSSFSLFQHPRCQLLSPPGLDLVTSHNPPPSPVAGHGE